MWYLRNKKNSELNYKMTTKSWATKCLIYSVFIVLTNLRQIIANDNTHYLPPLECNDPYGRPQVNICFTYWTIFLFLVFFFAFFALIATQLIRGNCIFLFNLATPKSISVCSEYFLCRSFEIGNNPLDAYVRD